MPTRKKGLGRGLDALLDNYQVDEETDQQKELPLDVLRPGKYQPRTQMDTGSLEELASSIRSHGLIQPISVRPLDSSRYEIIAGERRWRAARIAGLIAVPVIIRDISDEAALAVSLVENIQRENLNPLEEAQGINRLISEFSMTHQQAANAIGRSRAATSNLLRLLQLSEPVQEYLIAGDLEMGHVRALLALPKEKQGEVAQEFQNKGLSVREAERRVNRLLSPSLASSRKKKHLLRQGRCCTRGKTVRWAWRSRKN